MDGFSLTVLAVVVLCLVVGGLLWLSEKGRAL